MQPCAHTLQPCPSSRKVRRNACGTICDVLVVHLACLLLYMRVETLCAECRSRLNLLLWSLWQ